MFKFNRNTKASQQVWVIKVLNVFNRVGENQSWDVIDPFEPTILIESPKTHGPKW